MFINLPKIWVDHSEKIHENFMVDTWKFDVVNQQLFLVPLIGGR